MVTNVMCEAGRTAERIASYANTLPKLCAMSKIFCSLSVINASHAREMIDCKFPRISASSRYPSISGANFSTKVRKWTHSGSDSEADLGQFFLALDPKCFAPGFNGRLSEMNDLLRNLTPVNKDNPILIAGDPERNHMKKVDEEGGVQYTEDQIKTCNELSKRLNITPIKFNK